MKGDYLISIVGTVDNGKDRDVIELQTLGQLDIVDGVYTLCYDHNSPDSPNDLGKIIIESGDRAIIERSGSVNSRMIIEMGKRNVSYYRIPQGELMIAVNGKCVNFDLSEKGGNIQLKYSIDINAEFSSNNEVNVSIREAGNNV